MLDKNNLEIWKGLYPEGWESIVEKLYNDIEAISPGHSIHQIKEKFGGLRYYCGVNNYSDVSSIIDKAEKQSVVTCQICGEPGTLMEENYWYSTLCDKHRNNSDD